MGKIYCLDNKDFLKNNLKEEFEDLSIKVFVRHFKDFNNSTFLIYGMRNLQIYKSYENMMKANYYYIDTGYFGNLLPYRSKADKIFYRVSFNQMQMGQLTEKNDVRYKIILNFLKRDLNLEENDVIKPWKMNGVKILLCPPSRQTSSFFGIDVNKWIKKTVVRIKKYSNREIIIREKSARYGNTIQDALNQDIFILVTYNSNVATDAILYGIPVLTLGSNAAFSVSIHNISEIENPIYPERSLWCYNLASEQFHLEEFKNGLLNEYIKDDLIFRGL